MLSSESARVLAIAWSISKRCPCHVVSKSFRSADPGANRFQKTKKDAR